jgi:hypothetical protein
VGLGRSEGRLTLALLEFTEHKMTDTTIELRKKAKGERPQYFQDPAIDKVLAITMALAGEVAVMHDQIDTMQRLMEKGGPVTRADVAAYIPDTEVREERDAWRQTFLANVLRIVHQEREELALEAGKLAESYDAAVELVTSEAA